MPLEEPGRRREVNKHGNSVTPSWWDTVSSTGEAQREVAISLAETRDPFPQMRESGRAFADKVPFFQK